MRPFTLSAALLWLTASAFAQAIPTAQFLHSIGVNTAISARGESLLRTIEAIRYLGIQWIRSGYEGDVSMEDYRSLHAATGVKFSYGLMSGGVDLPRLLSGSRTLHGIGALLAFEGLNEPNNWPIVYEATSGGKDHSWQSVAQLQKDLYAAVKSDTALRSYPVWSPSETGAETDDVGLQFLHTPDGTSYADYATCHNYFSHPSHPGIYDNQTWNAADPGPDCRVDGLYGNYGRTWGKHFAGYSATALDTLPRVTTETGVTLGGEFTEDKQGKLYLNLYLSQFKRGWAYTAIYLLRDRSDESGNQSFGFYDATYRPRKAALYLHNLTHILRDTGVSAITGSLGYTIARQPVTVHDLLLQNSNGRNQLIIWGERTGGSDQVQLHLDRRVQKIRIFDPTVGPEPVKTLARVRAISLAVSDHPLIIEIE